MWNIVVLAFILRREMLGPTFSEKQCEPSGGDGTLIQASLNALETHRS